MGNNGKIGSRTMDGQLFTQYRFPLLPIQYFKEALI